jgi:hypothetical protein
MILTTMSQFAAIFLLALAAPFALADSVTGKLTLDGKDYPLSHAVAVRVTSSFAGGALVTRLALSDAVITPTQLRANAGLIPTVPGAPIHGVTLEFSDDRSYTTLNILGTAPGTSASLSGTMESLQLKIHTPGEVQGSLKIPERTLGKLRLATDLNFEIKVAAQVVVSKGAMKSGAAAQSLDSVKAYLAMRAAVKTGDMAVIRKVARYAQDFEGADGQKFLKMMREEEPSDIVVVEASEGADVATLTITGKKAGKVIRKTFDMQKKDGRWTTNNDNWEAN